VPPALAQNGSPVVIRAQQHDVSPALRDMVIPPQINKGRQRTGPVVRPARGPLTSSQPDPVAQVLAGVPVGITTLVNFDGVDDAAQASQSGFLVVPPDTNGTVGATQFVHWVNLAFAVFDKRTGAKVFGPAAGNTFWGGFGGPCETNNSGDPVIQYDKAAGRWVAAQPVFVAPFMYCLAVSTTSDATGRYNRYAFTFPAGAFPDYPKLGIWPDAYYATFNIFFASKFSGAMACAYDRTNMLAGNPASAVCFQEPSNVFSLLPSDLDGRRPPPAGSPNFVVGIADASDLQLFQFHVDFAKPKNSSFTGPTRSRWHRSAKSAIGPSIWLASPSRLPEKRWMRSVTG